MKCPECGSETLMPFYDEEDGKTKLDVICSDCGYVFRPKKEYDVWITWDNEGIGW